MYSLQLSKALNYYVVFFIAYYLISKCLIDVSYLRDSCLIIICNIINCLRSQFVCVNICTYAISAVSILLQLALIFIYFWADFYLYIKYHFLTALFKRRYFKTSVCQELITWIARRSFDWTFKYLDSISIIFNT